MRNAAQGQGHCHFLLYSPKDLNSPWDILKGKSIYLVAWTLSVFNILDTHCPIYALIILIRGLFFEN